MSNPSIARGLRSLSRRYLQSNPHETASQFPSWGLRSSRCDGWEFETLSSQGLSLWYDDFLAYPCHWLPCVGSCLLSTPFETWRGERRKALSIEILVQQVNSVVGIVHLRPKVESVVDWPMDVLRPRRMLHRIISSPGYLLENVLATRVFSPAQVH